jgi:predicted component of type VI protein secretion system
MPQLYVLSGAEVGKSFAIAHGSVAGRTPECAVVLKHASISRKHARFECIEGRWRVVDEGSRNGVIVERRRVPSFDLEDQAEFQLGEVLLRFRLTDAAPAVAQPAAAAPLASAAPVASIAPAGEPDEISLEEPEPDAGARSFASPEPKPAAPARIPVDPHMIRTTISPRVPPAPPPLAAARSVADTGFGPAPAAGAAISRSANRAGERILQYHKVENVRGVGGTDLAQLPGAAKFLIALGAAVVLAGLAWLAFSGTSLVKERIVERGTPEAPDDPPPLDGE